MSDWDSLPQQEQMARATAVQAKYGEELMRKAHVQGTAIGLEKVGGKYTNRAALVVMVDKKVPTDQLMPGDRIPDEIDGVPVDVQEMGVFTAQ
jgi:hypothetical protein